MTTTYRAWIDFLETLAPAGVVKFSTSGPPTSLSTADLPAQWLELPNGESRQLVFGAEGGDRTLHVDMIVALEPVAQNTQAVNFDACVTMLDSIEAVLIAAGPTSPLAGSMTWRSRQAIVNVAKTDYWSIVTSIDGVDL
jgi:hypothetical protein